MRSFVELRQVLEQAARRIASAGALLIGAGAGMGVDSGLPDFRGPEGFWRAYPPFRGRRFEEMANPRWFRHDPHLAWGFYGHRLQLYRETEPHAGFGILLRWARQVPGGAFVFTSNIDGHFQRAGFSPLQVVECHGSIHHLQCVEPCSAHIWSSEEVQLEIDPETFRAADPLPRCPRCGGLARPNVLMFNDYHWVPDRTAGQQQRYRRWLRSVPEPLVAIELGAGSAVPTVRREMERRTPLLVRINPREAEVPPPGIGIPCGALEALRQIDAVLGGCDPQEE